MSVIAEYRVKYTCDLESERNLSWGEGAICYCKQNGGKWWKIESGAWVEKLCENPASAGGNPDWADVQNKPATFPPSAHNHDASYSDIAHNHAGTYEPANSNIQAHVSSTSNPHSTTKAHVGLGNVDNTSDANKPVSTAQQTALDGKSGTAHNHSGTYEPANSNIQTHVASAHAPSNAQKNSDITKSEIEAKLTGVISSHSHSGGGATVATLSADVTNNNAVANTIADVTGLSFPVTSGLRYRFRFFIRYTANATTTGSRWSINGPTVTELVYKSEYSLTATSRTFNEGLTGYNVPAASNATSAATGGNVAVVEGIVLPSANGSVIARFASEVSSAAIVAKAGSYVEYQQI